MRKTSYLLACAVLVLFLTFAASCSSAAGAAANTAQPESVSADSAKNTSAQTFDDPFDYCSSVITIDQPDARYTGPKVSEDIIQGYIEAAGLQGTTMPSDVFQKSTIWRCMDYKVLACNFGANLPCDSKANTDKTPTQAMIDFCKENSGSDFIPMSVTGHATVYSWRCSKEDPMIMEQIDQADAAGYLTRIWYQINPKK